MALIGKIRNNSWLLIIFIGLGLALFIITSMFVGNSIPFLDNEPSAGVVDGEKIKWNEFQQADDALYNGTTADVFARRESLWKFFVENTLIQEEAKAIGLTISAEELNELKFGANPSRVVAQSPYFRGQTGQLDRAALANVQQAMAENQPLLPNFARHWKMLEKQIVKEQLQTKLNDLVSKAIYTPTWMVEQVHADQSKNGNFRYVRVPFDEINNNDVEVSDADYSNFLSENKVTYTQKEETRKVDYVVFDVFPTREDSMAIRYELDTLKNSFALSDNDTIFTEDNEGLIYPGYYNNNFSDQRNPLTEILADTLFNAPVGSVVGPYLQGNQYTITKLLERRVMPDSADSRHILINAQSPDQFASAFKTIDSLKNLIETGVASFDSLAIKFSQDGNAAQGGVYENTEPNSFVAEYSDLIFFTGEIGKLYAVQTQFGVHLIEPLARKYTDVNNKTTRVKVAVISRSIKPSEETQESLEALAQDMMATNRDLTALNKAASENGMIVKTSPSLKANDFVLGELGSGETSREMIRWAFDSSTAAGEVAPSIYSYQDNVDYFDSKYVVVSLRSIQAAGLPSVANIKDEIQPLVFNKKKGEMLKAKMEGKDLSALVSTYSSTIDTIRNVKFTGAFAPGLGNEPRVIAEAFNLQANGVSKPIVGNSGVFVIQMISQSTSGAPINIAGLRKQTSSATQGAVPNGLIQAMREKADVEDNRSRQY